MKLTLRVYDRINRRRQYRIVRWSWQGEYHLVLAAQVPPVVLCGLRPGHRTERYEGQRDADLCEKCWQEFVAPGEFALGESPTRRML